MNQKLEARLDYLRAARGMQAGRNARLAAPQSFANVPNSIGVSDPRTLTGGSQRFFDGDMAEILIYNTALTSVERQDVTEYLVAKWSIPEPASIVLLAFGGFVLYRRRRS